MGCITSLIDSRHASASSRVPILSIPLDQQNESFTEGSLSSHNILDDYDINVSLAKLQRSESECEEYLRANLSGKDPPDGSADPKDQESKDKAAALIQKQARRKAAKLRAEAEKRWLVFSNLDTLAEADMVQVARFMQTVMSRVPQLADEGQGDDMTSKAYRELNNAPFKSDDYASAMPRYSSSGVSRYNSAEQDVGNSPRVSVVDQGSDHGVSVDHDVISLPARSSSAPNIHIARSNSQNFILALRQVRQSLDERKHVHETTASSSSRPKSESTARRLSGMETNPAEVATALATPRRKPYWDGLQPDPDSVPTPVATAVEGSKADNSALPSPGGSSSPSAQGPAVFSLGSVVLSDEYSLPLGGGLDILIPDDPKILRNFDLPAGPITPHAVDLLITLYKKGGRLSMESMHKLLRLAYRDIKRRGNITRLSMGPQDRIIVVGDLHGQLADLMFILEDAGLPSTVHFPSPGSASTHGRGQRKYVFNGDFVDRGSEGAEVTALLLALYCAFPGRVCLNRGNHEDFAVCCAYGFQQECRAKYDNVTFGMFVELFQNLPLATVIDDEVLVLHGGLFHCPDATLQDLDSVSRTTFTLTDAHMDAVSVDAVPRHLRVEFLRQIQRDAMWSDPNPVAGLHINPRGAGVSFGPDITKSFLDRNGLKMLVRSHECVRTGFERPFSNCDHDGKESSDHSDILCTVFSASNYYGAGNTAAYLCFDKQPSGSSWTNVNGSTKDVKEENIFYVPQSDKRYAVNYYLTEAFEGEDDAATTVGDVSDNLSRTLYDLVLANKAALLAEFRAVECANPSSVKPETASSSNEPTLAPATQLQSSGLAGCVTKSQWAEVMLRVSHLQMHWLALFPVMVPSDCVIIKERPGEPQTVSVAYERFLDTFSASLNLHHHHQSFFKESSTVTSWSESDADADGVPKQVLECTPSGDSADSSEVGIGSRDIQDRYEGRDVHGYSESNGNSGAGDSSSLSGAVVEALYSQHRLLETVFRFFDKNCSGTITRDEFKAGCDLINESLPDEMKIKEIDRLLSVMDVSQNGEVDINEFFEMFRLTDAIRLAPTQPLSKPASTTVSTSLSPDQTKDSRQQPVQSLIPQRSTKKFFSF